MQKGLPGCSGVEGGINIYLFKFAGNGKCTRMFRIKCLSGWVDGPPHHRHRNNHKTHLSEKYGVLLLLIRVVQATTWFPEWASLSKCRRLWSYAEM